MPPWFSDPEPFSALGVEQNEQPVEQRECGLENIGQFLLGRLGLDAEAVLAVDQEALGVADQSSQLPALEQALPRARPTFELLRRWLQAPRREPRALLDRLCQALPFNFH